MRLSIEIHKATWSGGAGTRQMWLVWLLSSHSPRLTLVPQAINYLPLPPPRWQAASFNFLCLSFSALFLILSSLQLPNTFPLNKGLIDTYLINIWAFVLGLYLALKIAASISNPNKGLHSWKFAWYFQQYQLIQWNTHWWLCIPILPYTRTSGGHCAHLQLTFLNCWWGKKKRKEWKPNQVCINMSAPNLFSQQESSPCCCEGGICQECSTLLQLGALCEIPALLPWGTEISLTHSSPCSLFFERCRLVSTPSSYPGNNGNNPLDYLC